MLDFKEFLSINFKELLIKLPKIKEFLDDNDLKYDENSNLQIKDFLDSFSEESYRDKASSKEILSKSLYNFYLNSIRGLKEKSLLEVDEITIIAWNNKFWDTEKFETLKIKRWEIISIVWPTWSGKSRLLADIEWMASKDTPTKREILVNWERPPKHLRYSSEFKLVAQLSQNMNFIMDLSAEDFITLHAESRWVKNIENIVEEIIFNANELAWEKFDRKTPITALSWWQSRALMIADVAILSKSPIVLIDEIENAWVDRKKALSLLVKEDKIILIATHDPVLALLWNKRIIIKDGWIADIIKSSEKERKILTKLEEIDKVIIEYRNRLRNWEILS